MRDQSYELYRHFCNHLNFGKDPPSMWDLVKSKRIWVASLCASSYATIPFVLFPIYFVLIIFAIQTALDRVISYLEAPRYGVLLALRVHTAISLVGVLRFNFQLDCRKQNVQSGPSGTTPEAWQAHAEALAAQAMSDINCSQAHDGITNLIRVLVCFGLVWIWIKLDRRSLSVVRIGSTALVAFAALLLNAALTPRPGSVDPDWTLTLVWARSDLSNIILTYSEITFQVLAVGVLGYLLGHLCGPCLGRRNQLPHHIDFLFRPSANWIYSSGLRWYQLLAGLTAALVLLGLFTAQNSALYSDYPLDWTYHFDNKLNERFKYDALRSGLSGVLELLPFIASGTIVIWIMGKVRLTGIIPILAIGAIFGRLAGVMIGPMYETPFLTPLNSATLLGMIIAAGFGAVANVCAPRRQEMAERSPL